MNSCGHGFRLSCSVMWAQTRNAGIRKDVTVPRIPSPSRDANHSEGAKSVRVFDISYSDLKGAKFARCSYNISVAARISNSANKSSCLVFRNRAILAFPKSFLM